jgi:peptidoglycan hydrolase-like protein with peptidoglycan-binding domain
MAHSVLFSLAGGTMSSILKKGSSGDEVKAMQSALKKLGFPIDADGLFGEKTHNAIITMQTVFGYDVDGMAGPATLKLIEQQAGYGWTLEGARKAIHGGR